MERKRLPELPGAMQERAIWARTQGAKDPGKVETDNELLPWIYCEEDNLWYSFDGNYSGISPAEKIRKAEEFERKQEEWEEQQKRYFLKKLYEQEYWSTIRQKVLERDNYTCQKCGAKAPTKFHIHHILKRKKGGTDHFDNLITVCPSCHPAVDGNEYNPAWVHDDPPKE